MAVDFSQFVPNNSPGKKPISHHTSDIRTIEALQVTIEEIGDPISLYVVMKKPLSIGVPLQIQFEVVPYDHGNHNASPWHYDIAKDALHAYTCVVTSIKARIKPGNAEFNNTEEKHLNEIIHEPKANEINRFTGLEL